VSSNGPTGRAGPFGSAVLGCEHREKAMTARSMLAGAAAVLAAAAGAISVVHAQQAGTPTRTVMQKHDLHAQGEEGVLALVEMPVGSREGRHVHPAEAFVYVLEGTLHLDVEGRPSADYKAGQTFFIEAGKVHEGSNGGSTPVKAVAVFVADKGKPLTTQVK
jgi:quercetin dioxygenase-like cupin family protein